MDQIKNFSNFSPNVLYIPHERLQWEKPPPDFIGKILPIFSQIYPFNLVRTLQNDGYNPTIIGYTHAEGLFTAGAILKLLKELDLDPSVKIALELLPPQQIDWITEFLKDEREYKEQKTIRGKKPSPELVKKLKDYRNKVYESCSSILALCWLCSDYGQLMSIEHPDAVKWIKEDGDRFRSDEGMEWLSPPLYSRPFYTAIKRDLHGLGLIATEKPDIICVGFYHALKYDLLLDRGGEKSYYILDHGTREINWQLPLREWFSAHKLFLQNQSK